MLLQAKGFEITYLSKVPEVKDTVHKQSLLQHLTQSVLEKFPNSTDLYSELGALTRCSRVSVLFLNSNRICFKYFFAKILFFFNLVFSFLILIGWGMYEMFCQKKTLFNLFSVIW